MASNDVQTTMENDPTTALGRGAKELTAEEMQAEIKDAVVVLASYGIPFSPMHYDRYTKAIREDTEVYGALLAMRCKDAINHPDEQDDPIVRHALPLFAMTRQVMRAVCVFELEGINTGAQKLGEILRGLDDDADAPAKAHITRALQTSRNAGKRSGLLAKQFPDLLELETENDRDVLLQLLRNFNDTPSEFFTLIRQGAEVTRKAMLRICEMFPLAAVLSPDHPRNVRTLQVASIISTFCRNAGAPLSLRVCSVWREHYPDFASDPSACFYESLRGSLEATYEAVKSMFLQVVGLSGRLVDAGTIFSQLQARVDAANASGATATLAKAFEVINTWAQDTTVTSSTSFDEWLVDHKDLVPGVTALCAWIHSTLAGLCPSWYRDVTKEFVMSKGTLGGNQKSTLIHGVMMLTVLADDGNMRKIVAQLSERAGVRWLMNAIGEDNLTRLAKVLNVGTPSALNQVQLEALFQMNAMTSETSDSAEIQEMVELILDCVRAHAQATLYEVTESAKKLVSLFDTDMFTCCDPLWEAFSALSCVMRARIWMQSQRDTSAVAGNAVLARANMSRDRRGRPLEVSDYAPAGAWLNCLGDTKPENAKLARDGRLVYGLMGLFGPAIYEAIMDGGRDVIDCASFAVDFPLPNKGDIEGATYFDKERAAELVQHTLEGQGDDPWQVNTLVSLFSHDTPIDRLITRERWWFDNAPLFLGGEGMANVLEFQAKRNPEAKRRLDFLKWAFPSFYWQWLAMNLQKN